MGSVMPISDTRDWQRSRSVNLLAPGGGRFDPYPYPFSLPAKLPPDSRPRFRK